MTKKILVTGAAGFIGAFLCKKLIETTDCAIAGLDNLNNYYDVNIKYDRLAMLEKTNYENRFTFIKGDLVDFSLITKLFQSWNFDIVVNLAAQAGVRYSIENPRSYINSNLVGFFNILEACRAYPVKHLLYASSSSVYGGNTKVPFSETDIVDNPVSLYAATKKSDELLASSYSKLYGIPSTGLRFFTVYGPMGRPDMAYFSFTDKLLRNEKIKIFNMGNCKRDFTYIDDIIESITRILRQPFIMHNPDDSTERPHRIYNIGNSNPEDLLVFVDTLQRVLVEENILPLNYNFNAHKELVPMQKGDVAVTYADTSTLERDTNFKPSTPLKKGLKNFAKWYKRYYSL